MWRCWLFGLKPKLCRALKGRQSARSFNEDPDSSAAETVARVVLPADCCLITALKSIESISQNLLTA